MRERAKWLAKSCRFVSGKWPSMEAKHFTGKTLKNVAPLLQTCRVSRDQQGERHDPIDFPYRRGRFGDRTNGGM
jgi:hypothetical protein